MSKVGALDFYNYDLLGSLVGITAFSCLSAMGVSPFLWLLGGTILILPVFLGLRHRKAFLFVPPLVLSSFLVWNYGRNEKWSPYYSIITEQRPQHFRVYVNRFYHQQAVNFKYAPQLEHLYSIPYRFFRGGDVLVVGAGTGNDVAIALKYGAVSVDAVEIDPVIRMLGDRHPMKPYQDSRVHSIIQDARTFLQTTTKKYDLIVFGTLDSHALLSSVSTVRLDNYVYTLGSLESAKHRLKENGVLAMLYSIPQDWIFERLGRMVSLTFGQDRVLGFGSKSLDLNLVLIAKKGGDFEQRWDGYKIKSPIQENPVPTDDWPFLYLRNRTIPGYYLTIIAAILVIGTTPILLLMPKGKRTPHWNYLVLGNEKDRQHAFGSNLLGAFLGGFLEYLSMMIGFKGLILLVIVLYLGSYRGSVKAMNA